MKRMRKPKVTVMFGMQYGSEGKGLMGGYLGDTGQYDTVISVNMPNAGHTYIRKRVPREEYIFKVLPNSAVGLKVQRVMIGPDSVFSVERLIEEVIRAGLPWKKLFIHEAAVALNDEHIRSEKHSLTLENIGSTRQGSGAALVSKIRREAQTVKTAEGCGAIRERIVSHDEWMRMLFKSHNILLEGCQGYSLGLNAGFYPHCTSRDCTPSRLIAAAQIPVNWVSNIVGVCRTFPIRVAGNSGGHFDDQRELTWEELGLEPEYTTVTKKQRRIFSWSWDQFTQSVIACQPSEIFLNFCNYLEEDQVNEMIERMNDILQAYAPYRSYVAFTGHGPTDKDVVYAG